MIKGIITQVVRNSHVDGPGLRTVVFLKGCPLRCGWCHNPEAQDQGPEIFFDPRRCIDCGSCLKVCQEKAIIEKERGRIDRARCTLCMVCVKECPTLALEQVGVWMTTSELLGEIKKDLILYKHSGGGVTFSGGEPLQQQGFLLEMLMACQREGISTAVDTCGAVPWNVLEGVLPYVDLFLYDIKHTSREDVASKLVLENARRLSDAGGRIWFRIPLIPRFNADEEEIKKIGAFIRSVKSVEQVNLLPFHRFPGRKYEMLGRNWEFSNVAELSSEEIDRFKTLLSDASGYYIPTSSFSSSFSSGSWR